jgi:hypothetical protein
MQNNYFLELTMQIISLVLFYQYRLHKMNRQIQEHPVQRLFQVTVNLYMRIFKHSDEQKRNLVMLNKNSNINLQVIGTAVK